MTVKIIMILKYENKVCQFPHGIDQPKAPSGFGRILMMVLVLLLFLPALLFADYQYHTVKKGDTLYSLARSNGVTVDQIKELNNLTSNNLQIGQRLKIKETPAPKPKPVTPAQPASTPTPPPAQKPPTPPESSSQPPASGSQTTNLPDDYYHIVQPSEGPYRISQDYGLSTADFFRWNNKTSWDEFIIHPGDRLIIKNPDGLKPAAQTEEPTTPKPEVGTTPAEPSTSPAQPDTIVVVKTHTVRKGDTLYNISQRYGVTVDHIKTKNSLSSNEIRVGQILYLEGTPPVSGKTPLSPSLTEADLETTEVLRTDLFIPTQGRVSSEFGIRNGKPHKGIDIAAKSGTPIHAVLDGVVVYSGPQGNYGNVIVIEHPDFVMTVYAHNERNLVNVNDKVNKGQLIAYVGSTGNASGPHLHFEYRIKGKAINPRKVLSL